jgi:hypothetical protein
MPKQHFFIRLIPPRPTFVQDMTPDERALMGQHTAYTREFFERGIVLAYGPVMAPSGAYGFAVFEVDGESEVWRILDADPTVKAGLNTYEVSPMRLGGARASSQA